MDTLYGAGRKYNQRFGIFPYVRADESEPGFLFIRHFSIHLLYDVGLISMQKFR